MYQQAGLPLVDEMQHKLSEERVLPSEPGTCVVIGVVDIETLMNHACVGISGQELAHDLLHALLDLRAHALPLLIRNERVGFHPLFPKLK